MSRPLVTDDTVTGLKFARACVLDERASSHRRKDYSFDNQYREALDALDAIIGAHERAGGKKA